MINLIIINIKQQFNIKAFVLLQIIVLAMIFLLTLIFNQYQSAFLQSQQVKLGLINEDSHALSNVLVDSFKNNRDFTALFDVETGDKSEILNAFNNGNLDAYIKIPNNFTKSLLAYQNKEITIYTHVGFPTKTQLLKEIFSAYKEYVRLANAATITLYDYMLDKNMAKSEIDNINNHFSFEVIGLAMSRNNLFKQSALAPLPSADVVNYILIALPCAIIGFAMIPTIAFQYGNFKSSVAQRLTCTGQSNLAYVCSLHLSNVVVAVINLCSVLILAILKLSLIQVIYILLGLLFIALIWSIVWLLLILTVKEKLGFSLLAVIITLFLAIVGGSFTPFNILPFQLKRIGFYTPIFATSSFVLNGNLQACIPIGIWLMISIVLLYVQSKWHAMYQKGG